MSEEKLNTKKWLYNFKVPRKYNKKIEEESKDSEGKPITITREELVTEDVEVYLKRPSRKMFDECNLFYSVKVSEGVKAGLLTRTMIAKRYSNDSGALSKKEQDEFNQKYGSLLVKEKEFQLVQLNLQEDKEISDEARQKKLEEIVKEMEELKGDLEKFQVKAEDLYEHTAESRAARLTNMWWLLFLTYIKFKNEERGGIDDYMPFFAGKNFDKKVEAYELVEERIASEEDKYVSFESQLIERSSYLLSAWNGGNCKTFEDFERVEKSLDFIKDEVRKDETLQEVYNEKIKMLAGLEMPVEQTQETQETQEAEVAEVAKESE